MTLTPDEVGQQCFDASTICKNEMLISIRKAIGPEYDERCTKFFLSSMSVYDTKSVDGFINHFDGYSADVLLKCSEMSMKVFPKMMSASAQKKN